MANKKSFYIGMRDTTDPSFFVYIKELGQHYLITTPSKDKAQTFTPAQIANLITAIDSKYKAYFDNRDLVIILGE